jgi:hypothetical protein
VSDVLDPHSSTLPAVSVQGAGRVEADLAEEPSGSGRAGSASEQHHTQHENPE